MHVALTARSMTSERLAARPLARGASNSGVAYADLTAHVMFCGSVTVKARNVRIAAVDVMTPMTSPA